MRTEDIYTLLRNFYGLLVNDFPKTGLITKGIYEVEQVFKTIENLPNDQEHLIRYENSSIPCVFGTSTRML